jgi:hypothetical protein
MYMRTWLDQQSLYSDPILFVLGSYAGHVIIFKDVEYLMMILAKISNCEYYFQVLYICALAASEALSKP